MSRITEQTTLKLGTTAPSNPVCDVLFLLLLTPQASRKYVAKLRKGSVINYHWNYQRNFGNKRYDRNDKVRITSLLFLLRTRNMTRTGFISGRPCENAACNLLQV